MKYYRRSYAMLCVRRLCATRRARWGGGRGDVTIKFVNKGVTDIKFLNVILNEGPNLIQAVIYDKADNIGQDNITIVYDSYISDPVVYEPETPVNHPINIWILNF